MVSMKLHFRQRFETLAYSSDGDVGPTESMFNLMCMASAEAMRTPINHAKPSPESRFLNVYPSEHYRLLKAMVKIMRPTIAVDIGSGSGLNVVSLFEGNDSTIIHSFDTAPVEVYGTNLTQEHLISDRHTHHEADLSFEKVFQENLGLLEPAQIIILDGPKDGRTERFILDKMTRFSKSGADRFLIIDDIRVPVMIELWCSIASPKIDMTSFGHWSGTGIVDITNGLIFHNPNQMQVP